MIDLYFKCVKSFGWNLKDLDDTDFETLIKFIWHEETEDPNVRTIDGKTYKRAKGAPNWL